MELITTLAGVQPTALVAWLYELAKSANTEPMLSPCHPPSTSPFPLYVEPDLRPVYVREHGPYTGGLYASRPIPGETLLLISGEPVGDGALRVSTWCADRILIGATTLLDLLTARFGKPLPPDPAPAHGGESCPLAPAAGASCPHGQPPDVLTLSEASRRCAATWLAVSMAHMPDPRTHGRTAEEVAAAAAAPAPAAHLPNVEAWLAAAMVAVPTPLLYGHLLPLVQPPSEGSADAPAGDRLSVDVWLAAAMRRLPDPHAHVQFIERWLRRNQQKAPAKPVRRGPGAPTYGCNRWLDEKIAGLADPLDNAHLFADWLRLCLDETSVTGATPSDPRRSFNNAVARSLTRRKKRAARKNGDAPQAKE